MWLLSLRLRGAARALLPQIGLFFFLLDLPAHEIVALEVHQQTTQLGQRGGDFFAMPAGVQDFEHGVAEDMFHARGQIFEAAQGALLCRRFGRDRPPISVPDFPDFPRKMLRAF